MEVWYFKIFILYGFGLLSIFHLLGTTVVPIPKPGKDHTEIALVLRWNTIQRIKGKGTNTTIKHLNCDDDMFLHLKRTLPTFTAHVPRL